MYKDDFIKLRKRGKQQVIDGNNRFKAANVKAMNSAHLATTRAGLLNGAIVWTGVYYLYPVQKDLHLVESAMKSRTYKKPTGGNTPWAS